MEEHHHTETNLTLANLKHTSITANKLEATCNNHAATNWPNDKKATAKPT
jgi:hypothetical protein